MSAKYAILKDNLIVNIIVADADFIEQFYPEAILCTENFGVGDGYADGKFFSNSVISDSVVEDAETL